MLAYVHNAYVYLPGDRLSLPELCAARLDGDVVELGESFIPADRVETAHLRAAALAPLRGDRDDLALAGASAAWVHGAGSEPPAVHDLQLTEGRRRRRPPMPRTRIHEGALPDEDVVRLGDILVVTPERTLLDLIRWTHPRPEMRVWAESMARLFPELLDAVAARIARRPTDPLRTRAKQLLEELRGTAADQVVVTR